MINPHCTHKFSLTLNESPSEKEGKWRLRLSLALVRVPSMKVPPKRKGNVANPRIAILQNPSMKVPPKRKGNQKQKCERTPY